MKKLFVILFLGMVTSLHATAANEKAIKNFKETYPAAQKVTWGEYTGYSEVQFEENNIKSTIDYNEDGEVISSKRYYYAKYLPHYIAAQVKKNYKGTSIFGVTEVSNEFGIKYYITLESDKNWYTIECDTYGNVTTTDKFKKG